jgi:hypothetical protein
VRVASHQIEVISTHRKIGHFAAIIRHRDFNEGDLVLRLRQDKWGRHKLSPPWAGPYVVVKVLKPDTYKMANEDGEDLTNAWKLRRFYP